MNDAIEHETPETFSAYLRGLGLAPSTAATYERIASGLASWMENEGVSDATYRDVLAWVGSQDGTRKTKSLRLTAARHFYDWHLALGLVARSPAADVRLRGVKRPLPSGLLTEDQLATLFRSYEATEANPARQRNRSMIGVLAFQALDAGELARLAIDDVDLEGGLLMVPGSRTSERRTLEMEGSQVLGLHHYLVSGREAILSETGKTTDRLFVSAGSGDKLNNALSVLVRELRGRHTWFENARQLRSSRIALWLKTHDLREVQYRAGHRYVSSTERYRAADLDALHRSLAKHHPLA